MIKHIHSSVRIGKKPHQTRDQNILIQDYAQCLYLSFLPDLANFLVCIFRALILFNPVAATFHIHFYEH